MMDLGISLVVGMMEGGGAYFLNISSLDAQSKAGFCFALLGRSVTGLNRSWSEGDGGACIPLRGKRISKAPTKVHPETANGVWRFSRNISRGMKLGSRCERP